MPRLATLRRPRGFALVELAVVLVIVSLLAGGLLSGMAAQRAIGEFHQARQQLETVREALIGYAMVHGSLPCPANPETPSGAPTAGSEDRPDAASPCLRSHGVLPWATLGLAETDPWGSRLTYYAGSQFTAPVAAGTLASFSLETTGSASVRSSSTTTHEAASGLPAVIVVHGQRAGGAYRPNGTRVASTCCDELENANANLIFVAHPATEAFDDLLEWIAPSVLKARMIAAGRLP